MVQRLYKRIHINSGSPDNKAVIGFEADENKLELKIYYHLDNEEPELKEISITMGAAESSV